MKKIMQLMLLVGIIHGVVRGSEIREEDVTFGPSLTKKNTLESLNRAWYSPAKEAKIEASKVSEAPEGYHREGAFYVKRLPISGRHEKYEQFIEGYEPKQEFEEKMLVGRHPEMIKFMGGKISDEDIKRREDLLASPQYKEKNAQHRARLLKIEKEGVFPKEDVIRFGAKIDDTNVSSFKRSMYRPETEAWIPVTKGSKTPEGYHREGAFYVKELPISGEHEYYNQFIEGYEPKQEFEETMLLRRQPEVLKMLGEDVPEEDISRREAILASPAYQAQRVKERARFLRIEKEGVIPKEEQSQGYWSQFVNWLWSFGNTGSYNSNVTMPRQEYYIPQYEPSFSRENVSSTRE